MSIKLNQLNSVGLIILSISLLLTACFITGCGDEGDPVTDTVNGAGGETTEPGTEEPIVDPPVVDPPPDPVQPKVSFKDDISPILAERCATPNCHGAAQAAKLDLTNYDAFKKGGNSGAAFVAGDGKGSLVVKRIDGGGMPPPGGPPLDADQIQLFIHWIDEGAENN